MTTTQNDKTYSNYEKCGRGYLATQFGLTVHPYADARIIADFLSGLAPYHCAIAIARGHGLAPGDRDRPRPRACPGVSGMNAVTGLPPDRPVRYDCRRGQSRR
jgi:hypothetical protein